jgi:hypothetical protein
MSPVAKWQTQYLPEMLGACVPFPALSVDDLERNEGNRHTGTGGTDEDHSRSVGSGS